MSTLEIVLLIALGILWALVVLAYPPLWERLSGLAREVEYLHRRGDRNSYLEATPYGLEAEDRAAFLELMYHVQRYEEIPGVRLTSAARDMILLPIAEYYSYDSSARRELRERVGRDREGEKRLLRQSLDRVMATIIESPSRIDEGGTRSTLSVIRAFWKDFCHIPPFCAGDDEDSRANGTRESR